MTREKFLWLAAVINSHPNRQVHGRTRLQKTVKLLQSLKFPTDYTYTIHFYGPYSEDVQSDIGLLESVGVVKEEAHPTQEGRVLYTLKLVKEVPLPDITTFEPAIKIMADTVPVVLELAATYAAFREAGADHLSAIARLRIKKGSKCAHGNEAQALTLLRRLQIFEDAT
jgi:uncharacterized protein YwgA